MEVTTEGIEAAAVTEIDIMLTSYIDPDVEVIVDRPFIHFIIEKPTNMILFAGFVNDPKI
jgi:serine protease inhibitor